KERDTESGLDNFGARYMSSSMGRFMTPDWAAKPTAVPYAMYGDPQSLNLYTYEHNNPVAKADPDGHCGEDACVVEGVVGGVTILVMATQAYYAMPAEQRNFGASLSQAAHSVSGAISGFFHPSNRGQNAPPPPTVPTNVSHGTPGTTATNVQQGTPASTSQQGTINTGSINAANTPRSDLPRDQQGNYVPDPNASGPHSTLGTRTGSDGVPY